MELKVNAPIPPALEVALGVASKSSGAAPPGELQGVLGLIRSCHVGSPFLAVSPPPIAAFLPPDPSFQPRSIRCSATGTAEAFRTLVECNVSVALLGMAFVGILECRSNRTRTRPGAPPSVVPITPVKLAPMLLSGPIWNSEVSATGTRVMDSAWLQRIEHVAVSNTNDRRMELDWGMKRIGRFGTKPICGREVFVA